MAKVTSLSKPARPGCLSCLRGSEHEPALQQASTDFLSCLRGSERSMSQQSTASCFLSCLRGSELANTRP